MNLLYLHAAIPVGFLKVRVIISCCIFMSELLFGLCLRFCFKQIPQVFVLNKRVLWPQRRSCFREFFSFLTLSSVFITRGLISLIFLSPPDVIYSLFCGSKAEVVLRQFLVTWPCRAFLRARDLILPNFIAPWSCFVFCGPRAEVVLRPISVTWLWRASWNINKNSHWYIITHP